MMPDDPILVAYCKAQRAGWPRAAARIRMLYAHLPFSIAAETSIPDPTEEELREIMAPRIGPAWVAFCEAIEYIRNPKFKPPKNYLVWLRRRIEGGLKQARRADRRPFGPSASTARRKKKERKHAPQRADLNTEWLGEERTTAIWDHIDEEALTDQERDVVALVAAGNTHAEAADKLEVNEKTIRRELEIIKRRVKGDSAHSLAV